MRENKVGFSEIKKERREEHVGKGKEMEMRK